MASPAQSVETLPHRDGLGTIRRYAASVFGHRDSQEDVLLRLRGVLPLRYPGDTFGLGHDPLTGLATQPEFAAALRRCAEASARAKTPCSLVVMDVDHLGEVNRQRGYVTGDEMLSRVAAAISRHGGRDGRSFRIGGDEFVLLMPATGPDEAERRAAAILSALEHDGDDVLATSFSAGVAGGLPKAREYDLLYRQAAAALLDVKRHGRAGVALFDPDRHRVAQPLSPSGLELVERVISGHLLRPVFQPIIDLRSGHAIGYEGLVRVHDAERSTETRELFAAAEAVDRVAELDLACIDAVVGGAHSIRSDRLLTLNLSPRTLAGRAFEPRWLLERLVRAGISPSRVVIELADGVPIEDLGHLQTMFHELQLLGLRVAADDVTVDDPSRRLLTHLPFDIVKIDLGSIWEGAQTGPRLAGLRDFAYSRQARVVAEGVETSEQLVAVRDLEFGAAQGYLLGRPDASIVERVLELEELEDAAWLGAEPVPAAGDPFDDAPETIAAQRLAALLQPAHAMRDPEVVPA